MIVHTVSEPPPPALAQALAEFERQFTYPLGPGRSFRIEHGADYARFYRAIGDARCFVAEHQGQVAGVLAAAVRRLLWPDGTEWPAGYIGDVKIAPSFRGGTVLARLFRAAQAWGRERVSGTFGVVMDGTPAVPAAYTGRAGFPAFAAVGKTMVFRFSCPGAPAAGPENRFAVDAARGMECYRRLSLGRLACPVGTPEERSTVAPAWLAHPEGTACGCLEDTRRAKRLVADDGREMVSAHLSCFAWRRPRDGAELLRGALGRAAALGFPALFVAVADSDAAALAAELSDIPVVRAPATIFGDRFSDGCAWNINSAEI
jgi:hypothetical protein